MTDTNWTEIVERLRQDRVEVDEACCDENYESAIKTATLDLIDTVLVLAEAERMAKISGAEKHDPGRAALASDPCPACHNPKPGQAISVQFDDDAKPRCTICGGLVDRERDESEEDSN